MREGPGSSPTHSRPKSSEHEDTDNFNLHADRPAHFEVSWIYAVKNHNFETITGRNESIDYLDDSVSFNLTFLHGISIYRSTFRHKFARHVARLVATRHVHSRQATRNSAFHWLVNEGALLPDQSWTSIRGSTLLECPDDFFSIGLQYVEIAYFPSIEENIVKNVFLKKLYMKKHEATNACADDFSDVIHSAPAILR